MDSELGANLMKTDLGNWMINPLGLAALFSLTEVLTRLASNQNSFSFSNKCNMRDMLNFRDISLR
jgi:hypothetical protein